MKRNGTNGPVGEDKDLTINLRQNHTKGTIGLKGLLDITDIMDLVDLLDITDLMDHLNIMDPIMEDLECSITC